MDDRTTALIERGSSLRERQANAHGIALWLQRESATLLVAGVLFVLPFWLGESSAFLAFMVNVLLYGCAALGLQLIVGRAGLLSLGHAAFFGLGAYGSALLTQKTGVPFIVGLLAGSTLAALGALAMAPIIRLPPVYFAMASFAFGIVVYEALSQWDSFTGGHNGVVDIPPASFGGGPILSTTGYYFTAFALLALVYFAFRVLSASSIGHTLSAIRQSELGTRSVGVRVAQYKVLVLIVGGIAAGAAGSVYGAYTTSIAPDTFNSTASVTFLAMVVVGGKRHLWGALVGAFLIEYLISYGTGIANYQVMIYGGLLTLAMVLLPDGVAGGLSKGIRVIGIRVRAHRAGETSA